MLEQLIGELQSIWQWILDHLGWESSQLSWVQILVIALAIIGALFILRNILGGGHSYGGGSQLIYPPNGRQRGFPTRYYTGSIGLGDFSIPRGVYDFKVPSPTPNLSKLRGPVKLNLDKARELFIPPVLGLSTQSRDGEMGRMSSSRGLSVNRPVMEEVPQEGGGGERRVAADGSGTSQLVAPPLLVGYEGVKNQGLTLFSPNWKLARRLFIPRLKR